MCHPARPHDRRGNSPLVRGAPHPLTSLGFSLLALVAGASMPSAPLVLAVFLALLVPLAALSRRLRAFLRTCARVLWPFVVSLVLIQGFFTPGPSVLFSLAIGLHPAGSSVQPAPACWSAPRRDALMMITRPDALMRAPVNAPAQPDRPYCCHHCRLRRPSSPGARYPDAQRRRLRPRPCRPPAGVRPLAGPLILSSLMELGARHRPRGGVQPARQAHEPGSWRRAPRRWRAG
jgi:hypothetical protein